MRSDSYSFGIEPNTVMKL